MSFALPHLLWCLLIPVALLVWELTRARRAAELSQPKILRAEAGADTLTLAAPDSAPSAPTHSRVRLYFFAGLVFAILALARPQWGRIDEPVFDQSREIVLAVDLSRSMLTPDVKPSRLDRAKLLIQSLLERLAGERIGLIVFSGTAFLQSPLSADYEILREFLPALGPDYLPEGGTNYTALIQTAVSAFNHSSAADRFLIILSDGEATDDTWKPLVDELKKKNIRVLSLAIGTTAGGMIPDGSGGFVKDDRGAVVLSKLEAGTLRELADVTGGAYRDASTWVDLAALIQSTVDAGQKGQFVEKKSLRLVERFQWPLATALVFFLLSFWREYPVRPKPRSLRPPSPPEPALAAAAALLCLLASGFHPTAFAQPSVPAKTEAPPPSAQLSKIVGRLAAQNTQLPTDWAALANETLTWGRRLRDQGQPVPPGPVKDALQATDLLDAKTKTTADWSKLRAELEELLKKPDEQKQNQQPQDKNDQQQQQRDKNQDQQKQPGKNPPQSKPQEGGQHKDAPENKGEKPVEGKQGEKAFGDMQEKSAPPPPPSPTGDTQKVGGPLKKKPDETPLDPALAMPTQKLDQLRDQDSPAKLFKLMQGDPQPAPAKKGKNW